MLTLLNVPKGTRLLSAATASGALAVSITTMAPDTGSRAKPGGVLATREGYLHESTGILGQNPVEHLKLGGAIVDLSFSGGTSATDAGGNPSYTGVPWVKIPYNTKKDGTGADGTLYTHFVIAYGEQLACSAKRVNPSGTYAGKISCLHAIAGWSNDDVWFIATGVVTQGQPSSGGVWSTTLTISLIKLDYARQNVGTRSSSITVQTFYDPVYADPAQWISAVVNQANIAAQSITTYGQSYSSLGGPFYTKNQPSGMPSIPQFERFEDKFFPQDLNPDRWGDLASDCYSQIKCWDGNAAAYLRDSVLSVNAAKETVALAKALIGSKNPIKMAKSLASLFLSFRYGWCLQARDTASLLAIDFERAYPHGLARRSASRTYTRNGVPVTARMGVYFRPYSSKISELEGFLRSVDLDFTLENIWDLVPLSFVVDWFTGLGDLLDRMDQMAQLDSFDVRLVGRSIKTTKSLIYQKTTGKTDWHGMISAVYYKRHYQTEPIQPSLISYRNSNQKFDHWLEGTALIVQRL